MSLEPPAKVRKLQTVLHAKAKAAPTYRFYLLYWLGVLAEELRNKRYCPQAVRRVHQLLNTGHTEVVDADLSGYFDSIPRGLIW